MTRKALESYMALLDLKTFGGKRLDTCCQNSTGDKEHEKCNNTPVYWVEGRISDVRYVWPVCENCWWIWKDDVGKPKSHRLKLRVVLNTKPR